MTRGNLNDAKRIGVGDWACSPRERQLVNLVLDSGRLSYGPWCRQFEHEFANIHEYPYGVLSNSGTSSLQVALQAMKEIHGWPDGSPVIVPSVTFVATINIVLHNRLTPVLIDIEPDYYGMDVGELESLLYTTKAACVIPVSLFGMPCDLREIGYIASYRNDAKLIHDSCECMFARHYGSYAWADISCYSMYVAHLLTCGVGGISLTDNPDYAVKMRSLVNHGRDSIYISIDDDNNLTKEVVERRFHFDSIGHSYRITELEAAIACAQLENWREMIGRRVLNAIYLTEQLQPVADRIQLPAVRPHTEHSFMMYPLVMREEDKWPLVHYLEEHGIETREMLRLSDQPVYAGLWEPGDFPVAEWINRGGFYVGCHQGLGYEDMDWIAEHVLAWCKDN